MGLFYQNFRLRTRHVLQRHFPSLIHKGLAMATLEFNNKLSKLKKGGTRSELVKKQLEELLRAHRAVWYPLQGEGA
jgi:hypothetical protein